MKVGVTGGSGRIGTAVRADLAANGHEVRCIDIWPTQGGQGARFRRADLTEYWQALDALDGLDAVVHLAAVGVPERRTEHYRLADQATFAANTVGAYNVFQAASIAGVSRVVWTSSETVLGPPFTRSSPQYLPMDDEHPLRPETSYATSKAVGEELARYAAHNGALSVVCLRLSLVMDGREYADLPCYWDDPPAGRWNLWSYVDLCDVVATCRHALTADLEGSVTCLVAAPDTVMDQPTAELVASMMPDAVLRRPLTGYQSLFNTDKLARVLGYRPCHSWRDARDG
jgi:nucleoside-diphosphate-sugar epimerase